MNRNNPYSRKVKLTVGFTIFSAFFGAGNLIFPPYLGLTNGENWIWAFAAYIFMDAGLGCVTLIAVSKLDGGFQELMGKLSILGSCLFLLTALCLGPVACIPRTAAVTCELAVMPNFPAITSTWPITMAYFALVCVLCIRPAKIVDIIGNIMTPILLLGLMLLIGKGCISGHGTYIATRSISEAVKDGLIAGYQTMDMLVACLLCTVIISGVAEKGSSRQALTKLFSSSSLIAGISLFFVYGGLTYLGAVSEIDPSVGTTNLLVGLVRDIMGDRGLVLLAIIVTFACLTTAIGLVSACSQAICQVVHNKIPYKTMVILTSAVSFVISNLGVNRILAIASPILELVYPAVIVAVTLSFFPARLQSKRMYCSTIGVTLLVTALSLIDRYATVNLHMSFLPLSGVDLAWLLPAILCGAATLFLQSLSVSKPKR